MSKLKKFKNNAKPTATENERNIKKEENYQMEKESQVEKENDGEETKNESEKKLVDEEELQQIISENEEKIAALKDQYLRQVAEFDNYRKRTIKEKAELIKNGGERVIEAILPVVDDFERAIANIEKDGNESELLKGVELIYHKLENILKQQGLQKIKTEGEDFNTDYHEAIAMVPAPSEDLKGKVLDCVQTGYTLNDKVIRHAKVAVGE